MECKMYYVAYGIFWHKWEDRIRLLLRKCNNWNLDFWIFILRVIRIDYSRNEREFRRDPLPINILRQMEGVPDPLHSDAIFHSRSNKTTPQRGR